MTGANSQENKENASGPKIKIAKKDSRSIGDLRDTTGCGSYRQFSSDFSNQHFQSANTEADDSIKLDVFFKL